MAPLSALFFGLVGSMILGAGAAPTPAAAAADLSIGDIVNALQLGLVSDINAFITLDSLTTNIISANFDVKNPLLLELAIDRVVSSAGINGTEFARFDQTFNPAIVVPILGTKNSGTFGNVLLTQGVTASLDIIPLGVLDLLNADVFLRAGTIFGKLGIPIPLTGLKQSNVPTTYTLDLS